MSKKGTRFIKSGPPNCDKVHQDASPLSCRITTALKADAGAVIAAAQGCLATLDTRSFDRDTTSAVAAATRYVLSPVFHPDSTVDRRSAVRHLRELLDRICRGIPAERRGEFEQECRGLDVDPSTEVGQLTGVLVCVSDILRATIRPWRKEVFRRFGIVCRPDGFPIVVPPLAAGEVMGSLLDELKFVPIPIAHYVIEDHDGDEYQVDGPESDAGVGQVSMDRLRAWRKVGLGKLLKEKERLPPPEERKPRATFGADWPLPCALAGLSRPGVRGCEKSVDIVKYLTVERFGIAPPGASEPDDDPPTSLDCEAPELPSSVARTSRISARKER